jgi:hypothetical protein
MCTWCHEKEETVLHVLCDCEVLARLRRFRYLGMHFMEPSDYHEVSLNKILHYIDGAGLLVDCKRMGMHKRSAVVKVQGTLGAHPCSFIHSSAWPTAFFLTD